MRSGGKFFGDLVAIDPDRIVVQVFRLNFHSVMVANSDHGPKSVAARQVNFVTRVQVGAFAVVKFEFHRLILIRVVPALPFRLRGSFIRWADEDEIIHKWILCQSEYGYLFLDIEIRF